MTYQTELEAMSDGKLNFLMFESRCQDPCQYLGDNRAKVDCGYESFYINLDDYCNHPSYTMPLAFKKGIDFIFMKTLKEYKCLVFTNDTTGKFETNFDATHKNPLRCAVIILLLLENEK